MQEKQSKSNRQLDGGDRAWFERHPGDWFYVRKPTQEEIDHARLNGVEVKPSTKMLICSVGTGTRLRYALQQKGDLQKFLHIAKQIRKGAINGTNGGLRHGRNQQTAKR